MCLYFSEWAKKVNFFVSYKNAHQRVTSAEEDSNSQVDKMTCCVGATQLLFPATPVGAPGGREQSDGEAGMEVMHGFSIVDFHSSRLICPQPLLSAKSARSLDQNRVPDRALFPRVIRKQPAGR